MVQLTVGWPSQVPLAHSNQVVNFVPTASVLRSPGPPESEMHLQQRNVVRRLLESATYALKKYSGKNTPLKGYSDRLSQ